MAGKKIRPSTCSNPVNDTWSRWSPALTKQTTDHHVCWWCVRAGGERGSPHVTDLVCPLVIVVHRGWGTTVWWGVADSKWSTVIGCSLFRQTSRAIRSKQLENTKDIPAVTFVDLSGVQWCLSSALYTIFFFFFWFIHYCFRQCGIVVSNCSPRLQFHVELLWKKKSTSLLHRRVCEHTQNWVHMDEHEASITSHTKCSALVCFSAGGCTCVQIVRTSLSTAWWEGTAGGLRRVQNTGRGSWGLRVGGDGE